jgi:nicotinamide-nucleotide amidase
VAALDREESAVRARLGDCVFGRDEETMEAVVLTALARRGLTLAVAETATEGLLSLRLRSRGNDSATFRGGFVICAGDSGMRLLGIPPPHPADADGTLALARAARERANATIGLATTAITAADAVAGTRPGTVHVAIDSAGDGTTETLYLPGDRERIREFSVIGALNVLRHWLGRGGT